MTFNWNGSQYKTTAALQANIGALLMDKLQIHEDSKVLDAGCGVGNLTFQIAQSANSGFVLGIDSSDSMIQQCQKTAEQSSLGNIKFLTRSITEIEFNNEFDLIFSNSVLHWIKDARDALQHLFEALKTNGSLGLQFPLLNQNHPMIWHVNATIDELDLQKYFSNWEFPWFVPEIGEYSSLLRNFPFINFDVYGMSTNYAFESGEKVFNFFEPVGLNLYLSVLPEKLKYPFIEKLKEIIAREQAQTQFNLKFERIFAFAFNKSQN